MSLDVSLKDPGTGEELYTDNITHNLGEMAMAAGIYRHLWRPEEIGITKARQLIAPLGEGLKRLIIERQHLLTLSPSNGWGTYEWLVDFVVAYANACCDNPDAIVEVSR